MWVFLRNKGVLSKEYWLEWSLLWQEREGHLVKVYWKKRNGWKEQLSGLFITKSLNLQAEECTFKPRVNIIIFMHLSTVTVWEGDEIQHGPWGKIWKWEKIPFFFPPLIFLQVFLSQVGKKLDQGGKYYIVSPQAHIQETV